MENYNNIIYSLSDRAILNVIGNFCKQIRLQENKTQNQIALAAGVNRSTIVQIEKGGGGTLLTFIQILRALEQLHLLKNFEFVNQISPLALAKMEHKKRRRASKEVITEIKQKSTW
jgi:transcriptional regulator with XRE-family HTH domain